MTTAFAWQVAAEVARGGAAGRAQNSQLAVEVVRRSGLGVEPYATNSVRPSTFLLEAAYPPVRRAQSAQLAAEVVSRSGLGVNPLTGNGARSLNYGVEAAYAVDPQAQSSQIALEIVSRSGLGREPFLGNGARPSTFVVEVLRLSNPSPGATPPTYQPAPPPPRDPCACVITPELVPRMYTLRRPGRYK